MKKSFYPVVLAAMFSTAAFGAPFLAVGDGAELFLTGSVGVRSDDNIFLAKIATSDTIYEFIPGAEITFGKDAQFKGALTLADAISRYSSNSKLNTNLFSADLWTKFDDGKTKAGFNAGYDEQNQNTVDNRGLTRRDVASIGANGESEISQVTSVGGGLAYVHTEYKRTGYGTLNDYTLPINLYYKVSPKTDASFGYQYRDFNTTVGKDSTDNFFNVGARGEFSPLLTGQFRIGYLDRKIRNGSSVNMLGLDGMLSYAITPKSTLQFTASNSPDTSPQGLQQKNLALGASVSIVLDEQFSINGGVNYRAIDYGTRTDDYSEETIGGTYLVNAYVRVVGSYVHRNNSSQLTASQFTNNVFSLAISGRY
jgi:hypothetical protein